MTRVDWINVVVDLLQAIISGIFVGVVIYWLDERRAKRERRLSDFRIASNWETTEHRVSLRNFDLTNTNLSGFKFIEANLEGSIMFDCKIFGTDFSHANLRWADFRKSRLISPDFVKAMAHNTDFSGAVITASANGAETDFTDSILTRANFIKTSLKDTLFYGAELRFSNFSKATVINCDFTDADLSESQWKKVRRVENCTWKNVTGATEKNFPNDLLEEIEKQNAEK